MGLTNERELLPGSGVEDSFAVQRLDVETQKWSYILGEPVRWYASEEMVWATAPLGDRHLLRAVRWRDITEITVIPPGEKGE